MMNRVANFDPLRAAEMARAPYALVLWSFLLLMEHERITGLADRLRDVDRAGLSAYATHEPKELRKVRDDILETAGVYPTVDESLAAAADRMQATDAAVAALDEMLKGGSA